MRNRRTPDVRPGVASKAPVAPFQFKNWPPVTPEEIDEDVRLQNEEQEDSRQHMAAIETASRTLRWIYRAHPPNRAKAWQCQLALFTRSDYLPGAPHSDVAWGVVATVIIWHPGQDEFQQSWWAPTWRQAIEDAVHGMATL
jgi:hypothetical protein